MRFVYGKQDWKTFERGEENCYLMTNGLGGFSSLSMIGSCSRNDHAVFMACEHSPNYRVNMVHRLEEILELNGRRIFLSSQDYQLKENREQGYLYQSSFVFEDYPKWTYLVEGVEIIRSIVMEQGHNTVGISYQIRNRSGKAVKLNVIPHLQFMPKGVRLPYGQVFEMTEDAIFSNGHIMYYHTNGQSRKITQRFCDTLYYADDVCDGKTALGRSAVVQEIIFEVRADKEETLEIIYSTEDGSSDVSTVGAMIANVTAYRSDLKTQAGFTDKIAEQLVVSAEQFISERASTNGKTILAGFPFFEDWGRDTMIALAGCCLSTRQYDTAESILRTFMAYCKKGLMPNLFPEGSNAPGYNTVDAALLFVLVVYEYYKRSGRLEFVKEAYPVMKEIVVWYQRGTDFGIHMDEDGLIMAGQGYDQVTWMDVRVEDILPTPRHGKPVEINAYWYNALRIMDYFTEELAVCRDMDYGVLADLVRKSFCEKFWMEEKQCLRDVISGTEADEQIRCNQIWAISLPFSLLSAKQERAVVETVFRKLYTSYGLRTLAPEDAQFRPVYGGAQLDRDLAYHQGTVWTFPMGCYYLAYLKVHEFSQEAKSYVEEQLLVMEAALREGCIGQLPEIYDGRNPVSSKGCYAQAWSVGEILRVYDALR